MAGENILNVINQVNAESVPKATETAARFDESLSEIATKVVSFQRNSISTLDGYRTELTSQITSAEMQLQDSQRKLEVLFNRLTSELEKSSNETESMTSNKEDIANNLLSETQKIDTQVEAEESSLGRFSGQVEGLSKEVEEAVQSFKSTTTDQQSVLTDRFSAYLDEHSNTMDLITETLSEGTAELLDKMATLESNVEGKLGDYESLFNETIGLLTDQSNDNSEFFSGALNFAGGTTENVAAVFDGSIGDIADKLEHISGLIEAIEPILEFIDGLT